MNWPTATAGEGRRRQPASNYDVIPSTDVLKSNQEPMSAGKSNHFKNSIILPTPKTQRGKSVGMLLKVTSKRIWAREKRKLTLLRILY